jgi:hypothetical protein
VVDVDTDPAKGKQGAESLQQLIADHGELPETLMQKTGSGGLHYFFHTEKPYKNDSTGRIGKDIDCRCVSGYVIIPPSNHYSGGHYVWLNDKPLAEIPDWLTTNLAVDGEMRAPGKKDNVDVTADESQKFDEKDKHRDKFTAAELAKVLKCVPGDERDTWWKVGAALKSELGDAGFDVWDEWSQTSDKYNAKMQQVQWRSFKPDQLSAGTILHFAKENGWRGFDKEEADRPALKKDWIYCVGTKRFIELGTMQELDKEQFSDNLAPNFKRGRAWEHVLRNEQFPRVDAVTYWPEQPQIVEERGLKKLNMWRPSGVTPEPGDVSLFIAHIAYLFPDPAEQNIVLDYMAFQVQKPGQKVHWALLIQGVQGNGKSYLGHALKCVLGEHNVKSIHSDLLHETFTGWQKNTQFIYVEELMARGKLELMNKLKPMITEPWCLIREMYKPTYEQPNRFNFLFLTNHTDAVVIDNTDRRYCVLYSPAPPHPAGIEGYYKPLFDWTESHAGRLLYFLKQRDISKFRPMAHAPMTEGKRALIQESMPALDHFIREQVEALEWPFNVDLIRPCDLVTVLPEFGFRVTPQAAGKALARLKYVDLGRKRIVQGTDPKLPVWAVRSAAMYETMNVSQLRQVFAQQPKLEPRNESGNPTDAEIISGRQNAVKAAKPY